MADHEQTKKSNFLDYWKGNKSLGSAFWLLGVVYSALIFSIITVLVKQFVDKPLGLSILIFLIFKIYVWVSVWRCARNAIHKDAQIIARVLVVLDFVGYILVF